jgi:hypothetical protein
MLYSKLKYIVEMKYNMEANTISGIFIKDINHDQVFEYFLN